jgi:glyoxylase-like metal-dependent hydrolase (beta-lactamase superfamily II)
MTAPAPASLTFPFAEPPPIGIPRPLVPGVLWLRLALPFALNHVNIYLIEDGDGWAAIDAGIANQATREVWERVLTHDLAGRRITRLIVTHYHPDHAGLAGWLLAHCGVGLAMSRAEHATSRHLRTNPGAIDSDAHRAFYRRHGLGQAATEAVMGRGHAYLRMTTDLPERFEVLEAGQTLRIGGRDFEVLTGGGHAPEQVMLHCRAERLFFPADQVLARISPNISVHAYEPQGDPLAAYLASLAALRATIPADVLVAPMHNLPFHGLHQRIDELAAHHRQRCAAIAAACRHQPHSATELLPVVFPRALDEHQMGFAFGEVVAHTRYMLGRGDLLAVDTGDGVERVLTPPRAA